ncbi:hypothetical protein HN018_03905 [Lichenicola cladoniae]|uniref:LysR substrate-binding domain-containing protein n=1 Tax=Lichenicola cladoniae TaxID=1484109 RepID=A0A6M8HLR6_9PROT|nr:LysR substrate-binding domain-containing protein [Lichenicola cladoniae]NPD70088.1 hypothetical protein [Acetobacteraceae bacterium]QKE89287.1 hypothetical protein HN018_03905 [Lichenicola cladoniae]
MQALNKAPRGRSRVNAPVTFGTFCLAPLVGRYLDKFPEIEVELILSHRFIDTVGEDFDIVLRLGAFQDTTLGARSIAPHRAIACAASDYLRRRGIPKQPKDLTAQDCLGFVASSGLAETK